MATTNDTAGTGRSASTNTQTRKATSRKSTGRGPSATTSTQPKTRTEQAQHLAERAILVPVGASLVARDNLVSTVRGIATKYKSRAAVERELRRFERRGATARTRLERRARKTRTRVERELRQRRTRVERDLRQRRTRVERTVKRNRRRLEQEVRAARRDFDRQSGVVGARFEKLVADAQELIGAGR